MFVGVGLPGKVPPKGIPTVKKKKQRQRSTTEDNNTPAEHNKRQRTHQRNTRKGNKCQRNTVRVAGTPRSTWRGCKKKHRRHGGGLAAGDRAAGALGGALSSGWGQGWLPGKGPPGRWEERCLCVGGLPAGEGVAKGQHQQATKLQQNKTKGNNTPGQYSKGRHNASGTQQRATKRQGNPFNGNNAPQEHSNG